MKKIIAFAFITILVLSFTACGSNDNQPANSSHSGESGDNNSDNFIESSTDTNSNSTNTDGDVDLNQVAANMIEEAFASNSFSLAAAEEAFKQRGVSADMLAPDWDYTVKEDMYHAYGDSGSYGKGVVRYTKTSDGYLTDDDYRAWVEKVFKITASISDDGRNIQGFDWGQGDVEKTLDEVLDGFVHTWSYKYQNKIMNVYVEFGGEQDSDYELNEATNEYEWIHYYDYVQVDVGDGSQESWDWEDLNQHFDEHGDEIRDALEEYDE